MLAKVSLYISIYDILFYMHVHILCSFFPKRYLFIYIYMHAWVNLYDFFFVVAGLSLGVLNLAIVVPQVSSYITISEFLSYGFGLN